jgi:hypothetical protein
LRGRRGLQHVAIAFSAERDLPVLQPVVTIIIASEHYDYGFNGFLNGCESGSSSEAVGVHEGPQSSPEEEPVCRRQILLQETTAASLR